MDRYTCENLDEKLKLRVFVSSLIFVINLMVFIVSSKIYVGMIIKSGYTGSGIVLVFITIPIGLISAILWLKYIRDLKLKNNRYLEIDGVVSYASVDACMIDKEDGESVIVTIPKNVYKSMDIDQDKKVKVVITKNSYLIKEIEILSA